MSRITESARGQECTIRIIGVCNGDSATTVWAHVNGYAAGKGRGLKPPDVLGAYCCSACHDVYDGRVKPEQNFLSYRLEIDGDFAKGHYRSLAILIEKGLVKSQ